MLVHSQHLCRAQSQRPPAARARRPLIRCRAGAAVRAEAAPWVDAFSHLLDRRDALALPLPAISKPMRVVLVRHGESTWNAEGRLQGSSDESSLTERGTRQAERTRDVVRVCDLGGSRSALASEIRADATLPQLATSHFDQLLYSPLKRASQTAEIVWSGRITGKKLSLPALREVDLYEFQGLLKEQGKAEFGEQYVTWQKDPSRFQLNGRFPVRELWHRASIAWSSILSDSLGPTSLVVAHNAVNQALLCSAAGLPPSAFRRFSQGNGAVSVLDFSPALVPGGPAEVTVDRVNQMPSLQVKKSDPKNAIVLLVCAPDKCSSLESRTFGVTLGQEVAQALQTTGSVLSGVRSSKPAGAKAVANEILAAAASRQGTRSGAVQVLSDFGCEPVGDGDCTGLRLLRRSAPAEAADLVWQQSGPAWNSIKKESMLAAATGEGDVSVVVADPLSLAYLLCKAAGLSREVVWQFRFTPGGCTLLEIGQTGAAVVRCVNSLSHRTGADVSPVAPPPVEGSAEKAARQQAAGERRR